MIKIAVVVGSLRKGSYNRQFAQALGKLGAARFDFQFVELADLPMYNEDLWHDAPASVLRVKSEIEAADAVLFVTPEFNRSIPPVLKNVIDWGTRPWGQNSWAGKPASIVGTSPGVIGTAEAQSHLRSIVPILDMILLGQPEVHFAWKADAIDENGDFTNDQTREFLEGYLAKLERFIRQVAAARIAEPA